MVRQQTGPRALLKFKEEEARPKAPAAPVRVDQQRMDVQIREGQRPHQQCPRGLPVLPVPPVQEERPGAL